MDSMPLKTHSEFWACCRTFKRFGWQTGAHYHGQSVMAHRSGRSRDVLWTWSRQMSSPSSRRNL